MSLFTEEKVVTIGDLPIIKEAADLVRLAVQRLTAAETEAKRFKPGEITHECVTAVSALENSHRECQEARTRLLKIREREADRIREARRPGEQEARRKLNAALERARECAEVLNLYKLETVRLGVTARPFEMPASNDWAEEFITDFNRECKLDGWRRVCERDELL